MWQSLQNVTAWSSVCNWVQLTHRYLLAMNSQRNCEAIVSSFSFVIPQELLACGMYKASCWHFWGDRLSIFTDICIYLGYRTNTQIFISLYEKRLLASDCCLPIYRHLRIAELSTTFTFIITWSYQDCYLPPDLPACQPIRFIFCYKN